MTESPGAEREPSLEEEGRDRRSFLQRACVTAGWTACAAWAAGACVATGSFLFPRVRYEPPTRFPLGRPEDYAPDTVDSRWIKDRGVFVVRSEPGIYLVSAACTHLGCTVSWYDAEQVFKCPCHGTFFDIAGDVLGGPAPEPLYRVAIRRDAQGELVADKAQQANRPGDREGGGFVLHV